MPEEPNREARVEALRARPPSRQSMNRAHLGNEMASLCDISIEPGWVGILEELYDTFVDLPAPPRIAQIKEKFGGLCVYADGGDADALNAIAAAEGRARRTCQVCGCRGSKRKNGGWYATLCDRHNQDGGQWRGPGADDHIPCWALHAIRRGDDLSVHLTAFPDGQGNR